MKEKRKNILIISTPDITHAAGVIAYDLHEGVSRYHNSQIMVYASKHKKEDIISYSNGINLFLKKVINKIERNLNLKTKTDPNYYFFDLN